MANKEIREEMKTCNIPQWKLADIIGICEMTLIRWLRRELSPERKEKIINAIREATNNDGSTN